MHGGLKQRVTFYATWINRISSSPKIFHERHVNANYLLDSEHSEISGMSNLFPSQRLNGNVLCGNVVSSVDDDPGGAQGANVTLQSMDGFLAQPFPIEGSWYSEGCQKLCQFGFCEAESRLPVFTRTQLTPGSETKCASCPVGFPSIQFVGGAAQMSKTCVPQRDQHLVEVK